ncbi:MAG TPA: PKD domain-containing protein [Baekduia sp.]|nr:PKD domain-containing protein [Baekduia sp.]
MGRRVLAAAAVLAALTLLPASGASAATTRVVDQQAGPYTTITDALLAAAPGDTVAIHQGHYDEELWVDKDDITLRGEPGTIVSQTSPFVVSLMGARDTVEDLTIAGGPGGVRIEGDGAALTRTTVMADTNAVSVKGGITTRVDRSFLRATALAGVALLARNDAPAGQATVITTSVVLGGRQATAIDAQTGAVGDTATVGALRLALIHSTVVGTPSGVLTGQIGNGRPPSMTYYNTLNRPTSDTYTFVNPAALDFHLRESAVLDARADFPLIPDPSLPQPATDYDGVPLGPGPTSGAFQFVEHPPAAVVTTAATTVRQGVPVHFDASGSADTDPGGRIESYVWVFGDGTVEQTTAVPAIDHVFAQPGRPLVSVRATDQLGFGTTSALLPMTVTDAVAPAVRLTAPRDGSKRHQLRRSGRRRVVNVLKVAGTATDAGGVARVDVTLRRARTSYASRAVLKGGAFSWHTPAQARLARGRWTLTARATDRAGNISAPVLLHFTVT